MLRILTDVFFIKNLVSKFWRNLTITLAILVQFTLQKTESDFFSQFLCRKMAKARQEKNKNIVSHRTCFFSVVALVCVLFLHERFMFSQQPATNSFLMEERFHDGSSMYLFGQLGVFGGFDSVPAALRLGALFCCC
jgi:hypothetical protein